MAAKSKDEEREVVSIKSDQSDIPPEMAEALKAVPEPQRKEIREMLSISYSMMLKTSPEAEVAKKIKPEHITAMPDAQSKGMEYTYKENTHKMLFSVAILLIIVIAVLFVILLLRDSHSEEMSTIVNLLIGAALGFGGGYGMRAGKGNSG